MSPILFNKASLSRCLSFRSQHRRIWFGSLHPKNMISLFKLYCRGRVFAKMRSGRVTGGFFFCLRTTGAAAATFSVCLYNRNPLMRYWCGYGNRKRAGYTLQPKWDVIAVRKVLPPIFFGIAMFPSISNKQIDKENTRTWNLEPKVRLTIEAPRFCQEFGYVGVWTPFCPVLF